MVCPIDRNLTEKKNRNGSKIIKEDIQGDIATHLVEILVICALLQETNKKKSQCQYTQYVNKENSPLASLRFSEIRSGLEYWYRA